MLDRKFFTRLAKDLVPMYRKHIFIKGLDVYGKKFKPYSALYGIAKRSGKLPRQATEFANTTSPVLSSDLLRDWKLQGVTSTGFKFGTLVYGGRVKNLAKRGRVLSTNMHPLPIKIEDFALDQAEFYVKKQLKKIKGARFKINY